MKGLILLIAIVTASRVTMEGGERRDVPTLFEHQGESDTQSVPLSFAVKMRNRADLNQQW
jgi:hypothetical protein